MRKKISRGFDVFKNYQIIYAVVIIFVFALLFVPNFATTRNLTSLSLQVTDLLVIALGVTFTVMNGGLDFSATSVLALSSVTGAYIMALSPLSGSPLAIPVAMIVMILIGGIIGTINGFSVTTLKMPSFIVTLSMQLIVSGIAIYITSQVSTMASIANLPIVFNHIGGFRYFFIPIIIAVGVFLYTDWLITKNIFGKYVLYVGANPRTAEISGIKVKQTIFLLFLISGLYAGAQSILLTARNQAGISSLGSRIFVDVMAAVIIGGTSIFGGKGGARNTLLGVIFVVIVGNIMNLYGLDWYVGTLVKGLIIVLAALLDIFTTRLEVIQSAQSARSEQVKEE